MKRIIAFILTVLVLTGCFSCAVFATHEKVITVEFFEDGSYGVICVSNQLFLRAGSVSRTKSYSFYDNDHNLGWKASITASFNYNGTTASCTNVSKSTTIYDNAWECTASSCNKSGATATGNFTFKRYVTLIPVQTINKTLTLTCDPNGNIT